MRRFFRTRIKLYFEIEGGGASNKWEGFKYIAQSPLMQTLSVLNFASKVQIRCKFANVARNFAN